MREGRHGNLQHERASFVYIPEAGEPASAVVVNVAGGMEDRCPPSDFVAQPPPSRLNKRPSSSLRLSHHVTLFQESQVGCRECRVPLASV
jgi:hypothetical protein